MTNWRPWRPTSTGSTEAFFSRYKNDEVVGAPGPGAPDQRQGQARRALRQDPGHRLQRRLQRAAQLPALCQRLSQNKVQNWHNITVGWWWLKHVWLDQVDADRWTVLAARPPGCQPLRAAASSMASLRYILERLLHAIPVLLGVTIFVFLAIQLVPGDPIRIMMHGRISDQEVAAIYERLGMNRPLVVQYLDFLRHAAGGDLGLSIIQNAPVSDAGPGEALADALAARLRARCSRCCSPCRWRSSRPSTATAGPIRSSGSASMVGFAMPPFWIGLLLILCFGLWLGWFPISGFGQGLARPCSTTCSCRG